MSDSVIHLNSMVKDRGARRPHTSLNFVRFVFVHCVPKKEADEQLAITFSNLNADFQNSFTAEKEDEISNNNNKFSLAMVVMQ